MKSFKLAIIILLISIPTIAAGKITYNLPIVGTSMMPTIEHGDIIKVQTATSKDVKVGDIICYNYDKRDYYLYGVLYMCHRIISKTDEHICTMGDNNFYADNCIENKYVALKVMI